MVKHQVFDLPKIRLEVTEHRCERKICPTCQRISTAQSPEHARQGTGFEFTALTNRQTYHDFIRLLGKTLSAYPNDFPKRMSLQRIVLVDGIKVDGQERNAVPDHDHHALYFNSSSAAKEVYAMHIVNHEFYHFIEKQIFGDYYHKDPRWATLNDPSFSYGTGGKNMRSVWGFDHPSLGFVSAYATSALEEDKAELYGGLLVPEELKSVMSWAKMDAILSGKMQYLQQIISYHNRPKAEPVTETLWNLVAAVRAHDREALTPLLHNHKELINNSSFGGWTPLQWAAGYGGIEEALAMIDAGAKMEVQESLGFSATHIAAWFSNEALAKALRDRHAKLALRDKQGDTPAALAIKRGYPTIAAMLKGDPRN